MLMENQRRQLVALDLLGVEKSAEAAHPAAEGAQKPAFCSFDQSRTSPSVALSLRTRENSAMSLKHIFDRINASFQEAKAEDGSSSSNAGFENRAEERPSWQAASGVNPSPFTPSAKQAPPPIDKMLDLQIQRPRSSGLQPSLKNACGNEEQGLDVTMKRVNGLDLRLCTAKVQDPTPMLSQRTPCASSIPVSGQAVVSQRGFCPLQPKQPEITSWTQRTNGLESQTKAQLTILYSGMVHVYDDVPADKAHAIMLLAGDSYNSMSSHTIPTAQNTSFLPTSDPPIPALSSIKPSTTSASASQTTNVPAFAPQSVPMLSLVSACGGAKQGFSTALDSFKQFQPRLAASAAAKMSHAELPYARKTSLARFLEKRKDRVESKALVKTKDGKDTTMVVCERSSSPKRKCMRPLSPSFCRSSSVSAHKLADDHTSELV